MSLSARLMVLAAALSGLLGVALSAVARHAERGADLQSASQFLLFHAPALLALAALIAAAFVHDTTGRIAALALVVGLLLFCGDLCSRDFLGRPLFPNAAPIGGFALMAGWLLIGVAALLPRD
jgi:uncharacterized membrane protein YgdD (TMEM256/DUF423 family)